MKAGTFIEQTHGARVATIREGDNAVEIKDNRDGTYDLTVFWNDRERETQDDLTASRLGMADLMAMRRAIDAAMLQDQMKTTASA